MILKKKNLKLCLLVAVVVAVFPATAFAQGSVPDAVSTPLWVSLIALLVGYLTHAYQTGEVFGKKTLPKTYIPYVGAVATFGTAFLAALPQGVTLSKTVLEAASIAGLQAFIPMALGVAGHVAQTAHKSSRGVAAMGLSGSSATPTIPPANDNKSVPPPPAVAVLLLIILALKNQACISSAPTVPVTAANSSQISSCQNTAETHDLAVIGDFVFGGVGTTLGSISAAESNTNTKTALAIAAAGSAGVLIVGTAIAGLTASNFANSNCSSVVGPLPLSTKPIPPNNTTTVTVTGAGK
jgi:hypothetical protein